MRNPAPVRLRVVALLGTLLFAVPSRAEPTFSGYFIDAKGPVVSLTSEDGHETRWVAVGESFDGYKIASFDREGQKLTLTRDGRSVEIRLRSAHVQDARVARRAYLRTLRGLELAQELAKDGDTQIGDLLKRRQQVLDTKDGSKQHRYALDFLNERITELANERAAKLAQDS